MSEGGKDFSAGSMLLSFFLGGLVGASVALLIAPRTGEETRKKIKELADEAKEKIETYIEESKAKAADTLEKGKEFLEKEKAIVSSAIEAGKEAYEKVKEKAK